MTLLTAEGTLVFWDPSPVDTTSMQRSTFHTPSSNQAILIVSVSCCTLFPRLDGPSDHANERAIRSGITVETQLNYTCKGPCPLPCVYRLRFRLCSGTTNIFSSCKIASRSYSCLLLNLLCQVPHSQSIFSDCSSFYHFVEPLGDPIAGIWLLDMSLPRSIVRLLPRSMRIIHQLDTPYLLQRCCFLHRWLQIGTDDRTMCSNLVGRFDTAITSSSSAALSITVPSSSEVYLSLSGS